MRELPRLARAPTRTQAGFRVEDPFRGYTSGVFATDCSGGAATDIRSLNHAVLVVGFGVDAASGLRFWKARARGYPPWISPRTDRKSVV